MARKPNTVPTVTITLSTTPQVQNYLAKLADSGLYGKNPAEAGERLIARELERLITGGVIARRSQGGGRERTSHVYRALGQSKVQRR